MSNSDASMVMYTPSKEEADVFDQDLENVFACLKPVNPGAREAFNDSVNFTKKHPNQCFYMRQFLQVDRSSSVRPASPSTDDGSGENREQQLEWSGKFKFSLKYLPRLPGAGWSLGTGRGLSEDVQVDILLAPPSDRWKSIAKKHAYLGFHKDTGRIVLQAQREIHISGMGGQDGTSFSSGFRVLENGQYMSIGPCLYEFQYTEIMGTNGFQKELSEFMKFHYGTGWMIHESLASTTAKGHISIGNYTCGPGAFAKGSYGYVTAGWARNGSAVAIKRFINPSERSMADHQKMMRYIGAHVCLVIRSICDGSGADFFKENIVTLVECFSDFNITHPGAYCVYTPLALGSLSDIMDRNTADVFAQLTLLADYLKGLAYLHDQRRVMHRDVNPNNLGVVTMNPQRGILLDLDSATTDTQSIHPLGTLAYMAPEIIVLRNRGNVLTHQRDTPSTPSTVLGTAEQIVPYEKSVDIWALGLSVFAVYSGHSHFHWELYNGGTSDYVTYQSYQAFRDDLQKKYSAAVHQQARGLLRLVGRMAQWKPIDRIPVRQAQNYAQELIAGQNGGVIKEKGKST